MTKEALLDLMQKRMRPRLDARERASQILSALEGMSIWDAKELLNMCGEAILVMKDLSGYNYDPEKYAERVRQRMDWQAEHEGGDDE